MSICIHYHKLRKISCLESKQWFCKDFENLHTFLIRSYVKQRWNVCRYTKFATVHVHIHIFCAVKLFVIWFHSSITLIYLHDITQSVHALIKWYCIHCFTEILQPVKLFGKRFLLLKYCCIIGNSFNTSLLSLSIYKFLHSTSNIKLILNIIWR